MQRAISLMDSQCKNQVGEIRKIKWKQEGCRVEFFKRSWNEVIE